MALVLLSAGESDRLRLKGQALGTLRSSLAVQFALKRGDGAGNAGVYVTHQAGEPNSGGDLQSAENSQTLGAYGE